MVRQCAWCLRLIDSAGERVSQRPLPKLYEATHGMCCVCGTLWMEQATGPVGAASSVVALTEPSSAASPTVTQLVLDMQRREREKTLAPALRQPLRVR
jgi:hypothetical protein